jgi:polyphosphate kinase
MVRSFDRRIESLFELVTNQVRQQAIHILQCNLRDNVNTYEMQEDGSYKHLANPEDLGIEPFDIHKVFFNVKLEDVMNARLFAETSEPEHIELESI